MLRICLLLPYKARSGGLLQAAKQYEAAAILFRKQLSARHSAQAGPSHVKFLMEQACLAYQATADWSSLEDLIEVNPATGAWMLCLFCGVCRCEDELQQLLSPQVVTATGLQP